MFSLALLKLTYARRHIVTSQWLGPERYASVISCSSGSSNFPLPTLYQSSLSSDSESSTDAPSEDDAASESSSFPASNPDLSPASSFKKRCDFSSKEDYSIYVRDNIEVGGVLLNMVIAKVIFALSLVALIVLMCMK